MLKILFFYTDIASQGVSNAAPPINAETRKPYDSVVNIVVDRSGRQFKIVTVYTPDQVYPEYAIQYVRIV